MKLSNLWSGANRVSEESCWDTKKSISLQNRVQESFIGIKYGFRQNANFFVSLFFIAVTIAAAIPLECSNIEWSVLFMVIGIWISIQLFYGAFELSLELSDPPLNRENRNTVLRIASGAVLFATLSVILVALFIFIPHLWHLFQPIE